MQKLFAFLWRLSILVLPWQTRWIFIDGKIGNFPWEQGTVSFYASWIPMLATAAVAVWMKVVSRESRVESRAESLELRAESPMGSREVESGEARPERSLGVVKGEKIPSNETIQQYNNPAIKKSRSALLLKIALALILVASIFTTSLQATLVWWAYVLVIGAFAWSLLAMQVPRRSISTWFVISVIPHAIYGIQQFITQTLPGCKYLGVAEHQPWAKGTSVVEHGLYRVLRAYGGLPHPNVLGGWISASLALLPGLIRSARTKLGTYGWLGAGFILVSALVCTFSRGAWIASAFAFASAVLIAFFASRERGDRQAVVFLACICVAAAGFWIATQWDHVVARAQATEHLEMWSLLSRTESFVQGWRAFTLRPIAGWGPGAADLGVIEARKGTAWVVVAPEPPHAAPATFVLETGALGVLALVILFVAIIMEVGVWKLGFGKSRSDQTPTSKPQNLFFSRLPEASLGAGPTLDSRLPLIIALIAIALTDHYLVTLWPGIALFGIAAAIILAQESS
jgi:hypothetical protein